MVERSTGDVVGIVWTGKLPKSKHVQSSEALIALFQNPTEEIWEELAYAVPAPKVAAVLKRNLMSRALDEESKSVINSVISDL